MSRLEACGVGKEYEQSVFEAFERDTARHEMRIVRDAGIDGMHLRFKRPDSYTCGFELTTRDDYLCFCGDMGTYVLQRRKPMFAFFRTKLGNPLRIQPRYWSEKLQAADRSGGYKEFDLGLAKRIMTEELENLEITLSAEADEYGYCELEEFNALFRCGEFDEAGLRSRLEDFKVAGKLVFTDVWEHDFSAWTLRYIWCCWAIVWGIRKYDEYVATKEG